MCSTACSTSNAQSTSAPRDPETGSGTCARSADPRNKVLHSGFARWTRLGLWRRLGQRLTLDWRLARGDEVLPSAVVADSRSLRSFPNAWARGIDGGKLVKGIKLRVVCDNHGSLLDLELHPANTDDRAGMLPPLPRLAALGFQGDLLGDSGFKGAPFAATTLEHESYLYIVPSEHSTGAKRRQDAITQATRSRAHRMLIEGTWTPRLPARVLA